MKKERFVDWWKQDKRYMTLLKAVLMALLPLFCCLVRTAGYEELGRDADMVLYRRY